MANPTVVVDFVANTKDLSSGVNQATKSTSGFGASLKSMGKTAALAAGAAGIAGLTAAVKIGIDEYAESQKVMAQTNAVIKSTGGVANVTAKEVSGLAESLMKKTGVDDEAIASGENVLLTFTNIRNEAGKGNKIFNQATKATLDLSVALGKDMQSSALLVGKALNDPIKGMNALSRSGVQFTDAQKKQIQALVESGDTMKAQKLILRELNKEFGGSAEAVGKTLPGQLNILKEQFSNLAGAIVGELAPELLKIINLLVKHKDVVIAVIAGLTALATVIGVVKVATLAWNAATVIAGAATKAWTAVQWLLNAALAANPIGLVVIAIAALVAAFVLAYKHSDKFREIVDAAFSAVLSVAKAVFNWLKANWPLLLGILTGPVGLATVIIIRNWDRIKEVVNNSVGAVRNAVTSAWNAIKGATSSAWDAVTGSVRGAIGSVKDLMRNLVEWINDLGRGILAAALGRVGNMFDKIADGARAAYQAVRSALNNMVDFIGSIIDRVAGAASRIANALKTPINAVLSAIDAVKITIPSIKLPSIKIAGKRFGGGSIGGFTIDPFPNVPRLARGGVVTSPTLAMIGERGPEIVAPLSDIAANPPVNVRVFIGDTELKGLVRTEIVEADTGIARTLLAGAAG